MDWPWCRNADVGLYSIRSVQYRNEQKAGIPDRYRNKETLSIRMLGTGLRCRNADAGGIHLDADAQLQYA